MTFRRYIGCIDPELPSRGLRDPRLGSFQALPPIYREEPFPAATPFGSTRSLALPRPRPTASHPSDIAKGGDGAKSEARQRSKGSDRYIFSETLIAVFR
jgi:hypothetical protein